MVHPPLVRLWAGRAPPPSTAPRPPPMTPRCSPGRVSSGRTAASLSGGAPSWRLIAGADGFAAEAGFELLDGRVLKDRGLGHLSHGVNSSLSRIGPSLARSRRLHQPSDV